MITLSIFRRFFISLIILTAACVPHLARQSNSPVTLKLNLSKGETYYLASTSDQNINMEMMGSQVNAKILLRFGQEFAVENVEGDISTIRATYKDVSIKMDMASGASPVPSIEYDSENPTEANDPVSRIFSTLPGESFVMKITSSGKITEVTGLEEIVEKIIAASGAGTNPQMEAMFNEGTIRQGMEIMFGIYPDDPVTVGDEWTEKHEFSAGINFDISSTFKLIGRSNRISTLEVKGTIKSQPGSSMPGMEMMQMTVNMKGITEGTLQISEDTGWIQGGTLTQTITGSVEMSSPANPSQTMTMPMDIFIKTTYSSNKR